MLLERVYLSPEPLVKILHWWV